ncbi:class I SAM-dependent rRNA methyltransferase [Nibricoccus sp. IMCC34717]|uniref:class I SAM-dependent rRNA methyltransferase n=1 Tax=Nibricoccus sp. IMCC34717 TaxID=3034021 RepID=UPI00384D3FA0
MSTPFLKLKPNVKPRALRGHPWVFSNEVEALLPQEHDGEVVECRDRTGRFIGSGIYNSRSQICWRRFSRDRAILDAAYVRTAVTSALARRGTDTIGRLIWSESDGLPGVVVDRFDHTLVVQIQTLAMEKRRELLADVFKELIQPQEIVFRNDSNIRRLEGLPLEVSTLSGAAWEPRWVKIGGVDYWLDLTGGQKTGFYLDQREQHARIAAHAQGRRVLDCFCNQGAFALNAARGGATEVLGLDSAEDAIALARKNTTQSGLNARFLAVNVFDFLNDTSRAEQKWDLIVLDPPPFAKSKSAMEGAIRGYKEINLRAMQKLTPGGILATYTCSHHIQDSDLREIVASAAADARRRAQIIEFCHQPSDHPVLATMPESEYLRGYILRVD